MNYYEHHIGDYAEAAAHLTFVEDAAYSRLIRKYYAQEKPLPADIKAVQRLVGARSKDERQAVESVLHEFFELQADGWHQARCDAEIALYHEKAPDREAKRENERERQRRTRERRKQIFDALRDIGVVPAFDAPMSQLNALLSQHNITLESQPVTRDITQPVTRDDTATQTPVPRHQSSNTPPPATRAQAADNEVFPITAEWAPGPGFTAQAKLAGLPVLDPTAMAEGLNEFRGFWLARPHEIRTQAEWDNALAKSLKTRQVHAASRPKPSPGGRAGIRAKPPTAAELRVFRSSPQIMDPTARARCEAFTNAGHTAPEPLNVIDMEAPNGLAIGLD